MLPVEWGGTWPSYYKQVFSVVYVVSRVLCFLVGDFAA